LKQQALALHGKGIFGRVANFSALPNPTLHDGETWIALASEGAAWDPLTYYPSGQYYSNGVSWLYDSNPYQASQSDVNAGLIGDLFVSPFTLANSTQWATKQDYLVSGTNIKTITGNSLLGAGDLVVIMPTANASLAGTGLRVVEASTLGVPSATKELIDGFLSAGATATLLSNTANWNLIGVYIGTAITGTYQGQQYYDSDYYFVCVDDNDWIRIPRG